MNRRLLPLAGLATRAIAALAFTDSPPTVTGGPIDAGDTVWLLTATGLVPAGDARLAYFYAGMVSTQTVISTMLQSFTRSA
jgi:Amt family ammonium transporter